MNNLFHKLLKNHKLVLFLIVIFGLILRISFFSGVGTSDDLAYTQYASTIGNGVIQTDTLSLSTRLGLIYPLYLSYSLFGVNDFSSTFLVLLTSIGSIVLAYLFGKLLFDKKVALMAAFLMSFFPLNVVYATKLLTDLPSAFFMALGVYIFLYCEKKGFLKSGIGYLLSGIFIGIGYLIRESVMIIGLFFISYILYNKKIKKEYFLVPLGILAIFFIESLVFYSLTGDPFFRITSSQKYLAEAVISNNFFGRLDFPMGILHYPFIFLTNNLISYFYLFVFISIGYSIIYRKKETYYALFWLIPLILYLSFGSSSLTQYIPFKGAVRYLEVVSIPAVLILGYFLMAREKVIRKVVAPLTILLLLSTSFGAIYLENDRKVLDNLSKIYPEVIGLNKPTYLDERSIKALEYISGNKNILKIEAYPDRLDNIDDAYVIINQDMMMRFIEAYGDLGILDEIKNPPLDWKIIKEAGKSKEKVTIYYIQKR